VLEVVEHICNPSTQKRKQENAGGQPELHNKCKTSLLSGETLSQTQSKTKQNKTKKQGSSSVLEHLLMYAKP
jgi:hypothetical protein